MKKTKDIVVKDLRGDKLLLSRGALREIKGSCDTSHPFRATYAALREAMRKSDTRDSLVRVRGRSTYGKPIEVSVMFDKQACSIGCRSFSERTFNRIMKIAGAK